MLQTSQDERAQMHERRSISFAHVSQSKKKTLKRYFGSFVPDEIPLLTFIVFLCQKSHVEALILPSIPCHFDGITQHDLMLGKSR